MLENGEEGGCKLRERRYVPGDVPGYLAQMWPRSCTKTESGIQRIMLDQAAYLGCECFDSPPRL
jgi:hypothetical protein